MAATVAPEHKLKPQPKKARRDRDRTEECKNAKEKRAKIKLEAQQQHEELQRVHAELAGLKEEYKTAIQMLRDERSERKRLDEEVAHERRLRLMAEAARDRALGRV